MRSGYGVLLALVSATLFGASTPASKWLLADLAPFQLAGLLYVGAALATAPSFLRQASAPETRRLDAANRRRLAGAVLFGGVLGPVLLLVGLRQALAGSVSLLLQLEMVATAVLGVVVFREHLGRLGWAGAGGVVAAGALLAWPDGWPGIVSAGWVAAACVCWGLDNHLTALIDGLTPARSTFWKGSAAGATNLSIAWLTGGLAGSAPILAAALGVGALCYGASIVLYIHAAQELGAIRAQSLFATAPFIGAVLALAVLGEPLGATHLISAMLLAVSVVALLVGQHAHAHAHPPAAHTHSHRHDDGHHRHAHSGLPASTRHTHWHRHERLVHTHPHWPDVHHRHSHETVQS